MALGIETNTIAPNLIENAGQALVQGIRQIGQQISGHLTEMQTKRDLAGLAQSLQGADVQSNEFPLQLAQIASQHPMAVRDERGQMLMGILGKAHGAWQASEEDAKTFNRQMALQGYRTRAAQAAADAADKRALAHTKVGDQVVDFTDPLSPKVLYDAPDKVTNTGPKVLPPGSVMFDPSGKQIAANPKLSTGSASEERLKQKDRIAAINQEINQFDSDIASGVRQYEASFKREMEAEKGSLEALRHEKDKTEIGKVVDTLKAEKKKRLDLLEQIRNNVGVMVEPELGAVPPNAVAPARVLPAMGAVPVSPPKGMVEVIGPDGKEGFIPSANVEAALKYGFRTK